jgi:nucleotide-binding universal stress UspA family protein
VLVFGEEQEAHLIVVGATKRGPVARRMLGTVTTRPIERSRRPVLVITPPPTT